jgi:hypothetical protein
VFRAVVVFLGSLLLLLPLMRLVLAVVVVGYVLWWTFFELLMGYCGLYFPVPVLFSRFFLFFSEDGGWEFDDERLASSYLHGLLGCYIMANSPNYPDRSVGYRRGG